MISPYHQPPSDQCFKLANTKEGETQLWIRVRHTILQGDLAEIAFMPIWLKRYPHRVMTLALHKIEDLDANAYQQMDIIAAESGGWMLPIYFDESAQEDLANKLAVPVTINPKSSLIPFPWNHVDVMYISSADYEDHCRIYREVTRKDWDAPPESEVAQWN